MIKDKRFLGVVVNIIVSIFSLYLVAFLLNKDLSINILVVVIGFRILASFYFLMIINYHGQKLLQKQDL